MKKRLRGLQSIEEDLENKDLRRRLNCMKAKRKTGVKTQGYDFVPDNYRENPPDYDQMVPLYDYDDYPVQREVLQDAEQQQEQQMVAEGNNGDLVGVEDVESSDNSDDSDNDFGNESSDSSVGEEEGQGEVVEEDGGYLDEDGNPLSIEDYRRITDALMCGDGFDFVKYVNMLQHIDEFNSFPLDHNEPFLQDVSPFTKQQAAAIIHEYTKKCNMPASQVDDLLKCLKRLLPTAAVPVRHSKRGNNLINIMGLYIGSDRSHMLIFDCCPCGKTVYAGSNRLLDRCPAQDCKLFRYTPCKRCGSLGACNHSNNERTAAKVLIYHPFVSVLDDLLRTPGFSAALDYRYMDRKPGHYRGVSDGLEFRKHISQMEIKYADNVRSGNIDVGTKAINIALSVAYDGTQLYKRRAVKFSPLVITILNVPSNFRNKAGAGMFLLGVHTSDGEETSYHSPHSTYLTSVILIVDSAAEEFLIRDCFLKEMLHFFDGVCLTIKGQRYFVQARVILHAYDTRALQPMLKVSAESKKLTSCPLCGLVNTYLNKHFSSGTIEGARYLLPLNHYLRSFGQSKQCCPAHYYKQTEIVTPQLFDLPLKQVDEIQPESVALKRDINALRPCDPVFQVRGTRRREWTNFLEIPATEPFAWFHRTIDVQTLKGHLYYPCCDYRPQVHHRRRTNDEYTRDGGNAIITGRTTRSGATGLWLFGVLPYADIEKQLTYDPMHSLGNNSWYSIELFKGKRKMSADTIKFCKLTQIHPNLYKKVMKTVTVPVDEEHHRPSSSSSSSNNARRKTRKVEKEVEECKPAWVLRAEEQKQIEHCMNYVLVPMGYWQDYQIRNIFSQTGHLNESAKIKLVAHMMEFMVWLIRKVAPTYPSAYLSYHLMLSENYRRMLSPSIADEEIGGLLNRVIEMTNVRHGLYPPSESKVVFHQPVDIIPFFRHFGPMQGWWAMAMERMLHVIKRGKPLGGASHHITIIKRHIAQERNTLRSAYNFAMQQNERVDQDITSPSLLHSGMKEGTLFVKDGRIHESHQIISLHTPAKSAQQFSFTFNSPEHRELLRVLLLQVLHIAKDNVKDAMHRSCLFRLHYSYKVHKRMSFFPATQQQPQSFTEWIVLIRDNVEWLQRRRAIVNDGDDAFSVKATLDTGRMYARDVKLLVRFWSNSIPVHVYKQAIIYGVKFRSRGVAARERLEEANDPTLGAATTKNAENDLKNNFFYKLQYSSWFQFVPIDVDHPPPEINNNNHEFPTTLVGQFNFFFRLVVPDSGDLENLESILNGIPLASATARKPKTVWIDLPHTYSRHPEWYQTTIQEVDCSTASQSYWERDCFVPLTRVAATALLVVPMLRTGGEAGMPFHRKEEMRAAEARRRAARQGFPVAGEEEVSKLGSLFLISLHSQQVTSWGFMPERMSDLYHNRSLDSLLL